LQFTKFFAQFATGSDQLDVLDAILNGEEQLAGLAIDADLRWELLTGLAVGGRVEKTRLDQELASDNTSNGQRAHAAAVAAIPTAEAKAAAWHQLTETNELSNVLVNAASLGFVRTQDVSLLEPFVDKYFDNAVRIWTSNTFKIAEYLMENLYPAVLANDYLASKTREWLDRPEIVEIPALRRILVENLANVERALKAQKKDLEA
jgi:aminopeptidase N